MGVPTLNDRIELAQSMTAALGAFEELSDSGLIGQQVLLTGSMNALEFLIQHGVTRGHVERMLADVRTAMTCVEREAARRGIKLL